VSLDDFETQPLCAEEDHCHHAFGKLLRTQGRLIVLPQWQDTAETIQAVRVLYRFALILWTFLLLVAVSDDNARSHRLCSLGHMTNFPIT